MRSRLKSFGLNSIATLAILLSPISFSAFYSQEPVFAQTRQDLKAEADKLIELGNQQVGKFDYNEALQSFQSALEIYRATNNRKGEASALKGFGSVYSSLKELQKGIEFYQQALAIYRQYSIVDCTSDLKKSDCIASRELESSTILSLGFTYRDLGQPKKSLELLQQALEIRQKNSASACTSDTKSKDCIASREREGFTLRGLGYSYLSLAYYQKAIETFQQSLAIDKELREFTCADDKKSFPCANTFGREGFSLRGLAMAYKSLGQHQKADAFSRQASELFKAEAEIRHWDDNLAMVYTNLGMPQKALEIYQKVLAFAKQESARACNPDPKSKECIDALRSEEYRLSDLGTAYRNLGQYQNAIEVYLQALVIEKQIGNNGWGGRIRASLGHAYSEIRQYQKAIDFYLQALASEKQNDSYIDNYLISLGDAYHNLGQYQNEIESYLKALAIEKQFGKREASGRSLSKIGDAFVKLKQPELAILYYKQSVNVSESIRKDIRGLGKENEKSYINTVADTYRNLADLLLKQDRILEAQQVLDLLKVQELSDYLKTVRGNDQTAKGTDLQRPEQTFIALGNELADLQKLDRLGKLDPVKQQRLAYLTSQESDRNQQFNAFLKSPEVQKQIEQLRRTEQAQNVDIEKFNRLRKSLAQAQNAALLYPLILDDRLELILITATTPPIRRTINIKREVLNTAIVEFRANLRDPSSFDVRKDGQKFYDWLIHPFDAELQQAKVQTIIYAPDGQLRYIPLAALYDGKQWLVEKYRINNITASSLTDFAPRPHNNPRVLAAAATNSQNIQVGDRSIP
ncbi:tetratricopeptide repeat protein, partial [Tumidithrix elongata RA019]|nr:tetratricopeptide repeat protein [Tumidithrix elongata RA019]